MVTGTPLNITWREIPEDTEYLQPYCKKCNTKLDESRIKLNNKCPNCKAKLMSD